MSRILVIGSIVGWIVYLGIFIAKKMETTLPFFVQCYLADLLAIPLVLGLTNYLLKKYTSKPDFRLSPAKVLVACIYFSILFEWILPSFSSVYTADIFDVLCYFLGGGIYLWVTSYSTNRSIQDVTTV